MQKQYLLIELNLMLLQFMQNRGHYKNFYDMVKEFQNTLRHNDYMVTVDLATNLVWIETYVSLLSYQDDTMYRYVNRK